MPTPAKDPVPSFRPIEATHTRQPTLPPTGHPPAPVQVAAPVEVAPVVLAEPESQPLLFSAAPMVLGPLLPEDLLSLLHPSSGQPPVSPASLAHVLFAHALAAAEHFEDLLSLGSLIGVEFHGYQVETVRRVLRTLGGRALLADEVGLGKTIEAIMVLREYQLRGLVRRVLVLAPAPLCPHWVGELHDKARVTARTTDDPLLRSDPAAFWNGEGVLVASLSLCRTEKHAALIQARPWDLVIADEAHHLKNRTTLSWKLVNGLHSRFLLLVTATPIENDLEELYNLVTLLKPGQFATAAAFRKEYVDPKNPTAPKNRERLRALLGEVMVRNTRAQSGLRLPLRFVTTVTVEPVAEEQALYQGVLELLRTHGEAHSIRMLASTLLLEAGSSPHAVRGTLAKVHAGGKHTEEFRQAVGLLAEKAAGVPTSRKGQALLDLVKAHGKEQMLIFTRFRDTLAYVCQLLQGAGVPFTSFHGGMDGAAKQAAIQSFRDGMQVLVATDAGGEGQNLQFCHVLCNFDLPWNPMLIEQRIGRLHRMGQEHEVRVYNLCARGTVEERVLDVLDRRLHLFELVVGEMDMVLGNLVDDRDMEERILSLYTTPRTEEEIAQGFDALASDLLAARRRYEKTRELDAALFGQDYEA